MGVTLTRIISDFSKATLVFPIALSLDKECCPDDSSLTVIRYQLRVDVIIVRPSALQKMKVYVDWLTVL